MPSSEIRQLLAPSAQQLAEKILLMQRSAEIARSRRGEGPLMESFDILAQLLRARLLRMHPDAVQQQAEPDGSVRLSLAGQDLGTLKPPPSAPPTPASTS